VPEQFRRDRGVRTRSVHAPIPRGDQCRDQLAQAR
jgi:hypothetical protein